MICQSVGPSISVHQPCFHLQDTYHLVTMQYKEPSSCVLKEEEREYFIIIYHHLIIAKDQMKNKIGEITCDIINTKQLNKMKLTLEAQPFGNNIQLSSIFFNGRAYVTIKQRSSFKYHHSSKMIELLNTVLLCNERFRQSELLKEDSNFLIVYIQLESFICTPYK